MPCTPTTNPASVAVTKNQTIHLLCTAHAAYYQKVTASFNNDLSSPVATFTGTGENVAMKSDGKKMVSVDTGDNDTLYVGFKYSTDQGRTYQNAVRVCQPVVDPIMTSITSEDATDRDDNDSYFHVIDYSS